MPLTTWTSLKDSSNSLRSDLLVLVGKNLVVSEPSFNIRTSTMIMIIAIIIIIIINIITIAIHPQFSLLQVLHSIHTPYLINYEQILP